MSAEESQRKPKSAIPTLGQRKLQRNSSVSVRETMQHGASVRYEKLDSFVLPHPEHPYDVDYNANHALWLVSAASLVYADEEMFVKVAKEIWGFTSAKFFDDEKSDTQACAMANDDFIVVSFRGTESTDDWKTNMKYSKMKLSSLPRYAKVEVHKGFNTACLSVLPEIEAWVLEQGKKENPNKPLYISGHSLGGALATLCYAHWALRDDPISVNGVVTIGQPRVGTRRFVQAMIADGPCMLQRIFNNTDVVPAVPPRGNGFRHYGTPIYFTKRGKLVRRPAGMVTKADKAKGWASGAGGVSAHNKGLYLEKVTKYYEAAKKRQAMGGLAKGVFTIVGAKDLKAADKNGLSDPYCVIQIGDAKHKTPIIQKTLDPEWNHEIVIPEVHEHQKVTFTIWDWDKSNADDFLGQVEMVIDDFVSGEATFDLMPRVGKKDRNIKGEMTIRTQFHVLREAASNSDEEHARLHFTLHGARNVMVSDSCGTSDPYALVRCSGMQKKTKVVKKNLNPDWDLQFDVPSVSVGDVIDITVFDWDKRTKDDFLGHTSLELAALNNEENVEIPLQARTEADGDISGHCIISLRFTPLTTSGLQVAKALVTVHGGSNLKAADKGGTSDPYFVAYFGDAKDSYHEKVKSKVIKKTLNPTWDHLITLEKFRAGQPIKIEVWDHDRVGSSDFLGVAELRFPSLVDIEKESWALHGRPGKKDRNISGNITLSFAFFPIEGSNELSLSRAASSSSMD